MNYSSVWFCCLKVDVFASAFFCLCERCCVGIHVFVCRCVQAHVCRCFGASVLFSVCMIINESLYVLQRIHSLHKAGKKLTFMGRVFTGGGTALDAQTSLLVIQTLLSNRSLISPLRAPLLVTDQLYHSHSIKSDAAS